MAPEEKVLFYKCFLLHSQLVFCLVSLTQNSGNLVAYLGNKASSEDAGYASAEYR